MRMATSGETLNRPTLGASFALLLAAAEPECNTATSIRSGGVIRSVREMERAS